MQSHVPAYEWWWSCIRARTTWYGYVTAAAINFDIAANVKYSLVPYTGATKQKKKPFNFSETFKMIETWIESMWALTIFVSIGTIRYSLYLFFISSYVMNWIAPWLTPNIPGMKPYSNTSNLEEEKKMENARSEDNFGTNPIKTPNTFLTVNFR